MFCTYCGKELPDESRFCPSCGASMTVEEKKVEELHKPAYWDSYSTPNTEHNMSYNMHSGSGDDEYKRYKKQVAPFKITAGVMNLISLIPLVILALALIGVSLGEEDFAIIKFLDSGLLESIGICGVVALVACVIVFIMGIVGIAVPAKGGVICNFIATVICGIVLIWSAMLNGQLASLAEETSTILFSESAASFVSDFALGMYIFIFAVAFF